MRNKAMDWDGGEVTVVCFVDMLSLEVLVR